MCRLSWNLGTSTSWNPVGLLRPVMGLVYLFTYKLRVWTSFITNFCPREIRSSNAPEHSSVSLFSTTSRVTKLQFYSENKRMCLMFRSCTLLQTLLPLSSYTFSTFQLAAHKTLMVFLFTCRHPSYLFHINFTWFLFSFSRAWEPHGEQPATETGYTSPVLIASPQMQLLGNFCSSRILNATTGCLFATIRDQYQPLAAERHIYTRWFKYDRDWFVCKQV